MKQSDIFRRKKSFYKVVAGCAVKCNQKKKIKHVPSVWSSKELMTRLHAA